MADKAFENKLGDKNQFIPFASFVCAIMIVGLHAFNAGGEPLGSVSRFIEAVFSHGLFTGAVPIFMFISGYLFYRNVDCLKDCFVKQKKRITSLVMPFLAWSASYYLFYALGNKFFNISMVNGVDISLLGAVKGILFYEYCFPLWYLCQLITYVLFAPFVFLLLSNKKLSVFVWIGLIIAGLCSLKLEVDIWGSPRTLFYFNYFAYYFTGCIVARNKLVLGKVQELVLKIPLICLILIYVCVGILCGAFFEGYIPSFNSRCIVPLVAVALSAVLYRVYSMKTDIKIPKNVSTMIVYTIHPIVGVFVAKAVNLLPMPLIANYFLSFAISAIISCVASVFMRYIKPVYWVYSGNR